MVQPPSEVVTFVLPSDVTDDILDDSAPAPEFIDSVEPAPVVKPDTLPFPAVTELVIPPAGGLWPDLRWTVLQFFPSDNAEVALPFDDAELELLLAAWAEAIPATATVTATA